MSFLRARSIPFDTGKSSAYASSTLDASTSAGAIRLPLTPPMSSLALKHKARARLRSIFCLTIVLCVTAVLYRYPGLSFDSAAISKSADLKLETYGLPVRYSQALSLRMRKRKTHPVRTAERQANWTENLLPGFRYITAGPVGGTANQFHGATNLLYLAAQTRRITILPSLEAGWVPGGVIAKYSDFWDLDRYVTTTGNPVLEWNDLRENITSAVVPEDTRIGCWSSYEVITRTHFEISTLAIHRMFMDYWPMPPSVVRQPEFNNELTFLPLVQFDLEVSAREEWVDSMRGNRTEMIEYIRDNGDRTPPAENATEPTSQVMCYDNVFYVHTLMPESPAFDVPTFGGDRGSWDATGQFLHWNHLVDERTDELLAARLGHALQPFVVIHLRRNDFGKDKPLQDYVDALEHLYAKMATSDYAEAVGGVAPSFDPRRLPVFAVTDETDPEFLASLDVLGWKHYDHVVEQTAERYGAWWPSMLDAAVLSRGHGVVGTKGSTYSYQGILRAQAWQGAEYVWA